MEQGRPTDPRAKTREAAAPRVFVALIGALLLIFAATLIRAEPPAAAPRAAPDTTPPGALSSPADLFPHRPG